MTTRDAAPARLLGLHLVLAGCLVNTASLGWLAGRPIEGFAAAALWVLQGLAVLVGLALLFGRLRGPSSAGTRVGATLLLAAAWAAGLVGTVRAGRADEGATASGAPAGEVRGPSSLVAPGGGAAGIDAAVAPLDPTPERARELAATLERLEASERLRGALNERLEALDLALQNLAVPGPDAPELFAPRVAVKELRAQQGLRADEKLPYLKVDRFTWWLEEELGKPRPRERLDLLEPYLTNVDYVDEGGFRLEEGGFVEGDPARWTGTGRLSILSRHVSGRNHQAAGSFTTTWVLDEGADPADAASWRIAELAIEEFVVYEGESLPFTDELDELVADAAVLADLRSSPEHERLTAGAAEAPASGGRWGHAAPLFHPALAACDLNGDGFDDLFYGRPLAPARLLLSEEAGGFVEAAAAHGLDVTGVSAVAFADLDNDGDPDAVLGRGAETALYLENEGGRFADRTAERLPEAPASVMDLALVDFDRDGLLDVFAATVTPPGGPAQPAGRDPVRDRVGPPNVLLRNEGARLVPVESALSVRRDTVQAAFADFDDDGDPDAYLANDFAPDALYRNEGGAFVDVTAQLGIDVPGPSRGAAWGDYDGDGDLDLYVAGIDAPAARRIALELGAGLEQLERAFAGNVLLEQREDGFLAVSASTGFGRHVDRGGASWGPLFADLDNDRVPEILATAGGYTAPAALRRPGDLEADHWILLARAVVDPASADSTALASFGSGLPERSFLGGQRAHVWSSGGGRRFHEIGYLAQLALPGDGRALVTFDYDRDGYLDVALAGRGEPGLRLLRNGIGRSFQRMKARPRSIGLRFVGAAEGPRPSDAWSSRDGYGARVVALVEEERLVLDHYPDQGVGSQGSSAMVLGIGVKRLARSITVRWPSGVTQEAVNVPMGSFLTVYEDPTRSPSGHAFDVDRYVVRSERAERLRSTIGVQLELDLPQALPLNLVVAINGHDEAVRERFRHVQYLIENLPRDKVSVQAVGTDLSEGERELEAFVATYQPPFDVLTALPEDQRAMLAGHVLTTFGEELVPAVVAIDAKGTVVRSFRDIPTVSLVRQLLQRDEE